MPGVNAFNDLKCWKAARDLSKQIFTLCRQAPFAKDRRLVEQINDSSESVMSNIAEGFGRSTQSEFVTFLGYSLGSLDETRSHLCVAFDRQYLSQDEFSDLWRRATEIRKMTVGLISSMVQPGGGVKNLRRVPSWSEQGWEIYERVTGKKRPPIFEATRSTITTAPRNDEPPVG